MTTMILRLATRKSPLALWQANAVKQQLQTHHPDLRIDLVELLTSGDKNTQTALNQVGGKSLFVKELQTALLENTADIAVHSVKDMSVAPTPGLILAAICQREDPRDALVARRAPGWRELPVGAVVGTASPRRQCQLLAHRPDLLIQPLRGNVGTRLAKLDNGDFDAIILACAGLKRLGLGARITQYLAPAEFLPAIGQGALGIECRADDFATQSLVQCLDDWATHQCVKAERAVNFRLGGDCYTPIGAYAQTDGQRLTMQAMIGALDGRTLLKATESGALTDAERIGEQLAEQLLSQGAEALCRKF
jgi:hydroxymethylbilane synthase